jgi:hypothetical protein
MFITMTQSQSWGKFDSSALTHNQSNYYVTAYCVNITELHPHRNLRNESCQIILILRR